MSAEHPQPSSPKFEQLTIPFEAAYSTQVTTEELNKDPLAGIPSEWLKPADNAAEVQSHDVDKSMAAKGILRVKARIQARRQRNGAGNTVEAEDTTTVTEPNEDSTTEPTKELQPDQPESAFAKVAREAKEGRFDGKSLKKRAQEKLEARKAKKFATSKEGRIAKLEEELSGASSTIATDAFNPDPKYNKNYTPSNEHNMYAETDQQLARKRKAMPLGEDGDSRKFVDTRNKLKEMSNKEIEDYNQKVQELNALRGYKEVQEQKTTETKKTEKINDLSEEEFTAYLDGLSDSDTETIQKIIAEDEQLAEKLNNMTNQQRKDFIEVKLLTLKRASGVKKNFAFEQGSKFKIRGAKDGEDWRDRNPRLVIQDIDNGPRVFGWKKGRLEDSNLHALVSSSDDEAASIAPVLTLVPRIEDDKVGVEEDKQKGSNEDYQAWRAYQSHKRRNKPSGGYNNLSIEDDEQK